MGEVVEPAASEHGLLARGHGVVGHLEDVELRVRADVEDDHPHRDPALPVQHLLQQDAEKGRQRFYTVQANGAKAIADAAARAGRN